MSKRVLIIDDEERIRRMMRITFEAAGYAVGEAHDGHEGLKLYGDGSAWDAVVLDQRMPGMDGLEVLRKIKATNPRARVVMATAYASIELAVDAMKLGANDFVRKPMTPETLRNAVAAALIKETEESIAVELPVLPKPSPVPTIETITMNGFSILDPEKEDWQLPNQRRFTVVSPAGTRHEVLIQIDEEAVGYVERLARKCLPLESSFWTAQARRLLSDYLWNESQVPRTRKLTLKQISRDELLVAERWAEG
jgi:DNA-binding response OmpR family regulator